MRESGGYWVPQNVSGPGKVLKRAESLAPQIALCKQRRTCVQAGGNFGVYPHILAESFERVITFEPEHENFACLVCNTVTMDHVYAFRAFLGERPGDRALVRGKYSGSHQVGAAGDVPMYVLDNMYLEHVDAIFLDIEGFEPFAILGALELINRCKPLLVLEENKKQHAYGHHAGDLEEILQPLGYQVVQRGGEDIVLEFKQ